MFYLVEYLFYKAELKKTFLQCFTKTEHAAALQRRIYYSECLGAFPYFCLSNDKQMYSLGKTNYKKDMNINHPIPRFYWSLALKFIPSFLYNQNTPCHFCPFFPAKLN